MAFGIAGHKHLKAIGNERWSWHLASQDTSFWNQYTMKGGHGVLHRWTQAFESNTQ